MHTVGIYLIYAAVVVRGLVRLGRMHDPGLVVALLALYGLLLIFETVAVIPPPWHLLRPGGTQPRGSRGLLLACLLAQSGLVIWLLLNRQVQDFYALLFIPPSLLAVLSFGRRVGFLWIAAFTLAMAGPLLAAQEGRTFGLVMTLNYGGVCFLFGGYAHQVRVADTARREARRALADLEVAHHRLQGDAAQREELAAAQERNRLARDLHDSVTQTVFSMNLTVQSARLLMSRDRAQVAAQIERLEELAAGAMGEIQTLVSQLGPAPASGLAGEGLPAALRRLAGERRALDGLEVTLEVSGRHPLPEPVAASLYAIAHEALANVVKHAGTRQATVRLTLADGASCLEVEDAGSGFDPGSAWGRRGHLGLAGMAERAREVGWTLAVESHPGGGTRVRAAEDAGDSVG
ncbi:MAG TPA: sensor histidine kinase [Anaerolineae bacterium]|nr:sensor histidine kinase [Anaerolineae bacterium]